MLTAASTTVTAADCFQSIGSVFYLREKKVMLKEMLTPPPSPKKNNAAPPQWEGGNEIMGIEKQELNYLSSSFKLLKMAVKYPSNPTKHHKSLLNGCLPCWHGSGGLTEVWRTSGYTKLQSGLTSFPQLDALPLHTNHPESVVGGFLCATGTGEPVKESWHQPCSNGAFKKTKLKKTNKTKETSDIL